MAFGGRLIGLIFTDLRLGGTCDGGLQVMAVTGLLSSDTAVLVLTAYSGEDNRHASITFGTTHVD